MRPFLLFTLFAHVLASSTDTGIEKLEPTARKKAIFCRNAKAFIDVKDEKAASVYCSSVLSIPATTVTTEVSCITKTKTSTTSIKTYLAKPKTTLVAASVTNSALASGTKTITITTKVSTETYFDDLPLATCGNYYHGCQEKRDEQKVLANSEPKPTCLSAFSRSADISSICDCLSLTTSTKTETIKAPGATTATITRHTTGQTIRTHTRRITTATVTVTPSLLYTTTVSAVATETLKLVGPFKLGKDKTHWSNDWLDVSDYDSHDTDTAFASGSGSCRGSEYALNGTTLLKLGWDSTGKVGLWNRVGNINKSHGGGAFPVHWSTEDVLTRASNDRKEMTCLIGMGKKDATSEGSCPLVCRADGGREWTEREGKLWLGDEDENVDGVGLFVFKDVGPSKEGAPS